MSATVKSNSIEVPFDDAYFAELPASSLDVGDAELRRRYDRDGVLLLRGAIDSDVVATVRSAYLGMFDPRLFRPGSAVRDALFSGWVPDDADRHGMKDHPAHSFVRSRTFLEFADLPVFQRLAKLLLGGEAERLRRTPFRHFLPGQAKASRAHIDFTYLDGGSADVVTFWAPLGDCALADGGLIYLERSAELSIAEVRRRLKQGSATDARPLTHDIKALADQTGRRWLWADYRAGDLAIHSPFVIHASLNAAGERMRISTDIRYRAASGQADARWQDHWSAADGY